MRNTPVGDQGGFGFGAMDQDIHDLVSQRSPYLTSVATCFGFLSGTGEQKLASTERRPG